VSAALSPHPAAASGSSVASIFGRLRPESGMTVLAPAGAALDRWFAEAATQQRHGCVRYAFDGAWLYGCAELDDAVFPGGLQAAAQRAYADLFEVLAANDTPQVLRLWNYFEGINRESGGSERYRQFNAGRQQAFIEARHSAFEGSPAACALGHEAGPLRVYFLAGRTPPLALENPRQVSAYRYPDAYGPRSPTFSRAALVGLDAARQALFVSGTASIVGHLTMHAGDVRRQAEESLANIAALRAVAAHAGAAFAAGDLHYTVYLRRAEDLAAVRPVFDAAVGVGSSAARDAVWLRGDICRADLLVEIEAHGFVGKASLNEGHA
jgi:chorismate lyase/3-hydroxybenzoate synthase